MLGLIIKKNFFDTIENFVAMVAGNAIVFALIFLGSFISGIYVIPIIAIPLTVHCFGLAGAAVKWERKESGWFCEYRQALKGKILCMVIFYLFSLVLVFGIYFVGNLAAVQTSLLGHALVVYLFLLILFVVLGLQYYPAVGMCYPESGALKKLKKSFELAFNNLGISFTVLLLNIVRIFVSLFLGFLFPGLSSVALSIQNAVVVIQCKDAWIKNNPGKKHRDYQDEFLEEIRAEYQDKTLKNLLFPWKK